MKTLLLTSTFILLFSSLSAQASFEAGGEQSTTLKKMQLMQVADKGRGRGGDDNRSDDNDNDDSRDDNGRDNSSNDDNSTSSSSSSASSATSTSTSNNAVSGSNRRKPRVKGGSGCDDAGDALEHAVCR
jgi:hypothetical protein